MLLTFKMITLFIVFCFVSTCSGLGETDQGSPDQNRCVLIFESSILVSPDKESISRINGTEVEAVNFNETLSFLDGYLSILKEIGDNTMVLIVVEKEVSGQFEKFFTLEICDLCAELRPGSVYYKYLRFFGLPEECPIPAKEYRIAKFLLDTEDMPATPNNMGIYHISLTLLFNPDGSCKNEKIFLLSAKITFSIQCD